MQEEERRKEQQRRAEAEKQREEEQRQAAQAVQAKKDAQRQAAIEKAKQTRAPPPAARPQPVGPPEYSTAEKGLARPPSRLGSTAHQESSRPVNAVLSNTSKLVPKRPLQHDEENARPQAPRAGPSYQSKESKRIRMSEEFDEDIEMADGQRNIKGPPVRPSAGFKKVRRPALSGSCITLTIPSRSCLPRLSLPTAIPTLPRRRRGICSKPLSLRSIITRPRQLTRWIWRKSPRGRYPLPRIPPSRPIRTRLLRAPPAQLPPSRPRNRPPGHPHASRTERRSIFRRLTRMMRMMMMLTLAWLHGQTRPTCARLSCARRRLIRCRSSVLRGRLT